jgi:hypothetical protein
MWWEYMRTYDGETPVLSWVPVFFLSSCPRYYDVASVLREIRSQSALGKEERVGEPEGRSESRTNHCRDGTCIGKKIWAWNSTSLSSSSLHCSEHPCQYGHYTFR